MMKEKEKNKKKKQHFIINNNNNQSIIIVYYWMIYLPVQVIQVDAIDISCSTLLRNWRDGGVTFSPETIVQKLS